MAISKIKLISFASIAGILLLISGIGSFYYFGSYSKGDRAGVVIKLSQKGYLFNTWEGEMNRNDQGNTIEKFEFSVEDDQQQVIKDLREVALTGERVSVMYVERLKTFPWRGDTKYFVTGVIRQKNNDLRNDKENSRENNETQNETQQENIKKE